MTLPRLPLATDLSKHGFFPCTLARLCQLQRAPVFSFYSRYVRANIECYSGVALEQSFYLFTSPALFKFVTMVLYHHCGGDVPAPRHILTAGGKIERMASSVVVNEDSNYYSEEESSCSSEEGRLQNQERLASFGGQAKNLELNVGNLLYRGEGNCSLVVSLKKEGKVIRILKNCKSDKVLCGDEQRSKLEQTILFTDGVLRPLLGLSPFVDSPTLIFLTEKAVTAVNTCTAGSRPCHRLNKTLPSLESYALLLPDYCALRAHVRDNNFLRIGCQNYRLVGPVISTELKPKQGFLPNVDTLPPDLAIKASISRFCLKQYHKQRRGSVTSRSRYCPLDLFSGCPARMKRAIESLLNTPQNNFRLFKDLKLVYGEDTRPLIADELRDFLSHAVFSSDDFIEDEDCEEEERRTVDAYCNLLIKALLRPHLLSSATNKASELESVSVASGHNAVFCDLHPMSSQRDASCLKSDHLNENFCAICTEVGHTLDMDSVLGCILRVQRLDNVDSQKALEMALACYERNGNLMADLKAMKVPEKHIGRGDRAAEETEDEFLYRKVWEFMVSLTAKDFSVMVCMQRVELVKVIVDTNMNTTSIGLIDSSSDSFEEDSDEDIANNLPSSGTLASEQKKIMILVDETTGASFACSVSITDLDPKVPATIGDLERKWREKDYLVVSAFSEARPNAFA